jgi:prepilin-type N-terminal cleavage/methylation domain-containing protein
MKRGFTLIEAVIVIVMVGLIALLVGNFIITSLQAWLLVSTRSSAFSSARVAMNRMVAEMKNINRPQSIYLMQTSECRFLNISMEEIDFKQSGTNLLRNEDILVTNLASPEGLRFTYLNENGQPVASDDILDIKSIRIWLSLTLANQRVTLESAARIRNLR